MKQQYENYIEAGDKPFFKALLFACAVAISAVSCVTPKKACNVLDNHPIKKAEYCAASYKPTEKTVTKIKYLPGRKVLTHDTSFVTVDCDSVVKSENLKYRKSCTLKPHVVKVPVPTYLQVDTASIEEVIERENVAALAAKDYKFDSLWQAHIKIAGQVKTEQESKKSWRTRFWVSSGIGLFILLILVGIFTGKLR